MNVVIPVVKGVKKQKLKSLPKRTGKHKDTKQARYNAIQARKAARREIQEAAHARNVERGYTAWELAKEARRAKRANAKHGG